MCRDELPVGEAISTCDVVWCPPFGDGSRAGSRHVSQARADAGIQESGGLGEKEDQKSASSSPFHSPLIAPLLPAGELSGGESRRVSRRVGLPHVPHVPPSKPNIASPILAAFGDILL